MRLQSASHSSSLLGVDLEPEVLRARARRAAGRAGAAAPCRGARTSSAAMTARSSRSAKRAILARSSRGSGLEERATTTSGEIPMRRSSLTECCVGFVLSSPAASIIGTSVHVQVEHVVAAELRAQLADGLEERQALDVADRAADLDEHDVDVARGRDAQDAVLDLVGDVRDHLHGRAEVLALALAADDRVVDAARGRVRGARRVLVDEALVVTEVEVGLGAVLGDEDLAVLVGRHRARVDVHVRVELLHADLEPARLEQRAERGGGDALAERGDHSARDEDVLGGLRLHTLPPRRSFDPDLRAS